jgi:hypothetical protein
MRPWRLYTQGMKLVRFFGWALVAVLTAVSPLAANTITITTSGTLNGLPESARAFITTGANSVTIVLTNLIVDPTSAVQDLSGFQFSLSGGQTSATLTSSLGTELTIGSGGTYTLAAGTSPTLWGLQTVSAAISLTDLGFDAPQHTIIGAPGSGNAYNNANSSLTGSTHSPELSQTATFILSVAGVTDKSTITSAIFGFNTEAGYTLDSTSITTVASPEPATFAMLAGGLALAAAFARRRA